MLADYTQEIVQGFRKNEIIVFCGAGISFNSGIPVVREIKSKILDKLGLLEDEKKNISEYPQPFEAFMETLIERTDPRPLLQIFEQGEPNSTHRFLANLAKSRLLNIIVTTNVDALIEKAMDQAGVDYDLIYEEKRFKSIKWNDERVKIIKLHGSIHDKANIAVTIKQVAEKESLYSRKKVIDAIMSHPKYKSIWVIGYSCSDIFDINPCVAGQGDKTKTIFFLEHSQDSDGQSELRNISSKSDPNPFKEYKGIIATYDTDSVIHALWETLLSSSYLKPTNKNVSWEIFINTWLDTAVKDNGNAILNYMIGALFKYSADFQNANKYLFKAVEMDNAEDRQELTIYVYQFIGDIYRDTGKYEDAIESFGKAEYLAEKLKISEAQCNAINSIGIVYEDQKKHDEAIQQHRLALEIAQDIGLQRLEGKILGNIGIVLKNKGGKTNLKEAIGYQNRSLKIARNVGDKRSEGRTLGNLAIAYSDLGQKQNAIEYYEKAYKIAIELADTYHQAVWMANMGMDYIGIDNDAANRFLNHAIAKFQKIGSHHYVEYCKTKLHDLKKAQPANPANGE